MLCPRGYFRGVVLLVGRVPLWPTMVVGAIGTWLGLQGGSSMYHPMGLVILLAGLAIPRIHSNTDISLRALVAFPVIATSISDIDSCNRVVRLVVQLSGRINGLPGLLVRMERTFLVVYWYRIFSGASLVPAAPSRAAATPEWIKAGDTATHRQRKDS